MPKSKVRLESVGDRSKWIPKRKGLRRKEIKYRWAKEEDLGTKEDKDKKSGAGSGEMPWEISETVCNCAY